MSAKEDTPLTKENNSGSNDTRVIGTKGTCPVVVNSATDPAAVSLPVAILLPTGFLFWGILTWNRLASKMDDGQEQIFHGVLMSLIIAYPLGLAMPHAKIEKAMSLALEFQN